MGEIKTVYFAGKVNGHGYREQLFGSRVMSNGYRTYEVNGGKVRYGGPFALSCDHGCFHRDGGHGLLTIPLDCYGSAEGLDECYGHGGHWPDSIGGLKKPVAVKRCIEQIRTCDAVHAYIDTISCYGTLSELGYASALAKPIHIVYKQGAQNWEKHFWFIFNLPNVVSCQPGTETTIHLDLLSKQKSYKERYHEYLQSEQWNRLRLTKLQEAGHRCQLCNKADRLSVHHRTYDRVFNEQLADLIALCKECHERFHDIAN